MHNLENKIEYFSDADVVIVFINPKDGDDLESLHTIIYE